MTSRGTRPTRPLPSTSLQRAVKSLRDFQEEVQALELQAGSPQNEVACLKLLRMTSEILRHLAEAELLLQDAGGH